MKTMMIHFYREVVGGNGHSTETATKAMQRWGVPVLQGNGSERAYRYVDANDELLAKARAAWLEECAKRTATVSKGHGRTNGQSVTSDEVIAMLTKIDDAVGMLQREVTLLATAVSLGSVEVAVLRNEGKLESIINYLQSQAQTRPQSTRRK